MLPNAVLLKAGAGSDIVRLIDGVEFQVSDGYGF
jgi:hypothetical protein